jgi:hypothetical protein
MALDEKDKTLDRMSRQLKSKDVLINSIRVNSKTDQKKKGLPLKLRQEEGFEKVVYSITNMDNISVEEGLETSEGEINLSQSNPTEKPELGNLDSSDSAFESIDDNDDSANLGSTNSEEMFSDDDVVEILQPSTLDQEMLVDEENTLTKAIHEPRNIEVEILEDNNNKITNEIIQPITNNQEILIDDENTIPEETFEALTNDQELLVDDEITIPEEILEPLANDEEMLIDDEITISEEIHEPLTNEQDMVVNDNNKSTKEITEPLTIDQEILIDEDNIIQEEISQLEKENSHLNESLEQEGNENKKIQNNSVEVEDITDDRNVIAHSEGIASDENVIVKNISDNDENIGETEDGEVEILSNNEEKPKHEDNESVFNCEIDILNDEVEILNEDQVVGSLEKDSENESEKEGSLSNKASDSIQPALLIEVLSEEEMNNSPENKSGGENSENSSSNYTSESNLDEISSSNIAEKDKSLNENISESIPVNSLENENEENEKSLKEKISESIIFSLNEDDDDQTSIPSDKVDVGQVSVTEEDCSDEDTLEICKENPKTLELKAGQVSELEFDILRLIEDDERNADSNDETKSEKILKLESDIFSLVEEDSDDEIDYVESVFKNKTNDDNFNHDEPDSKVPNPPQKSEQVLKLESEISLIEHDYIDDDNDDGDFEVEFLKEFGTNQMDCDEIVELN